LAFAVWCPASTEPDKRPEKPAWYFETREAWQLRADRIRQGILLGAQLWPLPKRTPLNAVLAHRRIRGSYSVENVAFESKPGFFVFGNLYRPLNPARKVPAVLVPHGHFKQQGWFARTRPENQKLCATLAQMGAAVFTYDMVGWGDSRQAQHSAPNVLQLQLWDSLRAVDFVAALPEVDPGRIGVTGASGGATQAIYLAAVEPRIQASMPVAMVSSRFTGNELCEDGMNVHQVPGQEESTNVEIAAAIAPKPLLIVSDKKTGPDISRTRIFPRCSGSTGSWEPPGTLKACTLPKKATIMARTRGALRTSSSPGFSGSSRIRQRKWL
jgi:uncharacterized protein